MQVGLIGLGKMGARIAKKLHENGHDVIVWNRSNAPVQELQFKIQNSKFKITTQNLKVSESIQRLVQKLERPRVIWSMVPAGKATDQVLAEVSKYVEKDDIVIDGGNSFFSDTQKRFEKGELRGIRFLGIGVSGGVHGEKNGFSLMAGGNSLAFDQIVPILKTLSSPNGSFEYFGLGGAGHFVKMVHNGIEYGMMQSIGEGFEILKKSSYGLDLLKVAKVWQKGTIVSGFLIDRMADIFQKDQNLKNVIGELAATGEAQWTVDEAKKQKTDVEIIGRSLEYRKRSKTDKKIQNSFTAKVIASLRNAFGGHEVKKKF